MAWPIMGRPELLFAMLGVLKRPVNRSHVVQSICNEPHVDTHKPAPEVKCGKRVRSKKQAVGSSGEKPSLPSERYPRDEEAQGKAIVGVPPMAGEKLRHHFGDYLVKAE